MSFHHGLSRSIARRKALAAFLALLLGAHLNAFAVESLQAMVDRANAAANAQNYPVAIALYEQVVQKAPKEALLRKNLAVLYANYGVSLQEQKKYDEALRMLDKGLALVEPGSREAESIRNAKAGVYFSQAMSLRDEEPVTAESFAKMHQLLEKAMSLNPGEAAFKKGAAAVYQEEAYQLASQEKYEEAIPLLEKALGYFPQSATARQSLANVYLGLAKNNPEQRQQWLEKALATDNSPRIQQAAENLRAVSGRISNTSGFAHSPGEAKTSAPRELSRLSLAEMIRDVEIQLQITPSGKATLLQRLENVEKQVYGKTQGGNLSERAKNVYTALMGSYDGMAGQANLNLTQAPIRNADEHYLADIFKVTDGKIIRWGRFPIRVYFEEPSDKEKQPLYKPEYKQAALKGFEIWKTQTNGFVNFVEVKNKLAADVVVDWQEQYIDRFADPDQAPTVYQTYTPPKRTKLMTAVQLASMFTPGYFSLAPQAVNAAMQHQQQKKLQVLRDESQIHLGLGPVKDLPPDAARRLIQNMAAKEFGHVLGLKGSSNQPGDLLYPELRSDVEQMPTQRDLATLREVYNRPPNIILNVR
jgi:tetratricopeptide (TPR) repeat protein